jgi:ATP-independent RNA helicase DbpA
MVFSEKRTALALKKLGFSALKEIQKVTLDEFKNENEIVLIAPTGSGKTLAFLFPILESLENKKITQALVIAPSRELALQIEQVFKSLRTDFKISCCYGGHQVKIELNNLVDIPQIIVGTPGRIADHLRRRSIHTDAIKTLVLDEFDKSLEMGFEKDIKFITDKLEAVQKRVLVSATSKDHLPEYCLMPNPKTLQFVGNKNYQGELKSFFVKASNDDKLDLLKNLIYKIGNEPTIIFCNHREAAERINDLLFEYGIPTGIFHGALKQEHRERELIKLRNKSSNILLATDLASRGIDIPSIKNVIHYQLPTKQDAFIHRNGRTARMEANGNSFIVLKADEKLPDFASAEIEEFSMNKHSDIDLTTDYVTMYLNLGKKNKINKVDIVGLFYQKGGLVKDELGKIEVLDYCAYVAVKRTKSKELINTLRKEKIKKQSFIVAVSR